MNIFFDVTETLGSVAVDTSGRIIKVDAYSYVPAILERLSSKGFALGAIFKSGDGVALHHAGVLQESGILKYLTPGLLIETIDVGLRRSPEETFEAVLARARSLGKAQANDTVFVGENRGDRTTATVVGMKAAPHMLLAEAVAAGEYPIYVKIKASADETTTLLKSFDQAPFVPFYQAIFDEDAEVIALSTEGIVQSLRADFDVAPLSDKIDAVRDDLYLLLDAGGLDQQADFVAELRPTHIKPVCTVRDGLLIALPPHQNIDAFHHGAGHGHNLKLLPDMPFPPRAKIAEREFSSTLSTSETQIVTSVITEKRMEEMLRFVTGVSPRAPTPLDASAPSDNIGSNRHVLSPKMQAVTTALMAKLEQIGGGAFKVTGQPFEITGGCVQDVRGVPVAETIQLQNVIAELPGEIDECVLLTAHLDSTAVETYKDKYNPQIHDAPGMDDDGSGVAAVLLIAEALKKHFADRNPSRTLRFVLFNAEEQGLIGSQRYAISQAQAGASIVAVFQLDMIGYNLALPNSFETHAGTQRPEWCHYNARVEKSSLALSNLVREISKNDALSYLTPAQVYKSPDGAAGRSDHTSFHMRGYPACLTCEDFFPCPGVEERNPRYHRAEDQQANLPYATAIARVVCGAVMRVCDPSGP